MCTALGSASKDMHVPTSLGSSSHLLVDPTLLDLRRPLRWKGLQALPLPQPWRRQRRPRPPVPSLLISQEPQHFSCRLPLPLPRSRRIRPGRHLLRLARVLAAAFVQRPGGAPPWLP